MVWGRWTVSKLGDSCLSVLEVSPSLPPYLKTYHCRWLLELQTWMQSYELKMDASSSTWGNLLPVFHPCVAFEHVTKVLKNKWKQDVVQLFMSVFLSFPWGLQTFISFNCKHDFCFLFSPSTRLGLSKILVFLLLHVIAAPLTTMTSVISFRL